MVKNLPTNEDMIPGLGISPGEGYDDPFQYSCLGNYLDRQDIRKTESIAVTFSL